jgi:hypothetical protein
MMPATVAATVTTSIRLDAIALDPRAHVRAALDPGVVTVYAERMAAGDVFPPIVLFRDGAVYHLADGWHRVHAAQQLGEATIVAEVRGGSERDALWHGLGAQRTHGYRLTEADTTRAVDLAIMAWPDMSAPRIADHIGCHRSYVLQRRQHARQQETPVGEHSPTGVVGRDGRHYTASAEVQAEKHRRAAELFAAGARIEDVCRELHLGHQQATIVRRAMGLAHGERVPRTESSPAPPPPPSPSAPLPFRSRAAVEARIARMRTLAADGYTSAQIAETLGVTVEGLRPKMRKLGIAVPADAVVSRTRLPNSLRIVEAMVYEAEHLCDDIGLIDFHKLPAALLPQWVAVLQRARRDLARFIRQLQEQTP